MAADDNNTITHLLEEHMRQSDQFSKTNFGLKLGSDFPEMAREVLRSNAVTQRMFAGWMIGTLRIDEITGRLIPGASPQQVVAESPGIYETPLSFLYWGMHIGRQLQRQQDELEKTMAAEA